MTPSGFEPELSGPKPEALSRLCYEANTKEKTGLEYKFIPD